LAREKPVPQVQQLEDSCCAEKLGQVGLSGKRKLLEFLAKWLVSFEPDKPSSDVDREIFAAITQVVLEDWLSLQRREGRINQKKIEACRVEEELYKVTDANFWTSDQKSQAVRQASFPTTEDPSRFFSLT
jgi:hypothetical protein